MVRPIISGWEGTTGRISSFIDQPLLKYKNRTNPYPKPKDTTDFLNFIEKTKVAKDTILVSMDVTSLYYIPQEEGIEIVCRTYETFYGNELPIPTHFLIFMAEVETDIIKQSPNIPLIWKRIIDIFSPWNTNKEAINSFTELANSFHPAIKFTAEISDTEITFLDTCVYKGDRFKKHCILDVRTRLKPTETFQYKHFNSCHPPDVRKGFIKGEALRLLRSNSSKTKLDEHIALFKQRLQHRGYPDNLLNRTLSEVNFSQTMSALQNKQKTRKRILPFVTEYRPSMPDLKHILVNKWHLIQNQPLLRKIFKKPTLISYRKGRSSKDVLVRAKL